MQPSSSEPMSVFEETQIGLVRIRRTSAEPQVSLKTARKNQSTEVNNERFED